MSFQTENKITEIDQSKIKKKLFNHFSVLLDNKDYFLQKI